MRLFLLATAGGAIGAGARYLVNVGAARWLPATFPWATFLVNVVGSAVMGLLTVLIVARFAGSPELRTFLATGILGGFTTFSAFSLDAANLFDRGAIGLALAYVVGSVLLSIGGLYLGAMAGRYLAP